MANIPEFFGSLVFNDQTMRQRLPKDTYKALKKPSAWENPLTKALQTLLRQP